MKHGDSRLNQRKPDEPLSAAADGVCPARVQDIDGRSAKKLGVTENTLNARLWRAAAQCRRLGSRLRRMKDDMNRRDGRSRVQLF